jgi:hypothetical protein
MPPGLNDILGQSDDRVEWRPELVGHVGEELRLVTAGECLSQTPRGAGRRLRVPGAWALLAVLGPVLGSGCAPRTKSQSQDPSLLVGRWEGEFAPAAATHRPGSERLAGGIGTPRILSIEQATTSEAGVSLVARYGVGGRRPWQIPVTVERSDGLLLLKFNTGPGDGYSVVVLQLSGNCKLAGTWTIPQGPVPQRERVFSLYRVGCP